MSATATLRIARKRAQTHLVAREAIIVREDVDAILGALFDIRRLLEELVDLQREEDGDGDDA